MNLLQTKENTDSNMDVVLSLWLSEVKDFSNLFQLDCFVKVREREVGIDINRKLKMFCKSNFVMKIHLKTY